MIEYRAAYRYAKSLLDLATEAKKTDDVYKDMVSIDDLISTNRHFLLFLQSPIIKHQRKVPVMKAVFDGKVEEITSAFLELVTAKGRAPILHAVTQQFQEQYLEMKGIQKAEVTTAFKLDDALRKDFEKLIEKISERKPQLGEEVDEDVIGGFILDVGDRRLDTTLRSNLKRIEYELTP